MKRDYPKTWGEARPLYCTDVARWMTAIGLNDQGCCGSCHEDEDGGYADMLEHYPEQNKRRVASRVVVHTCCRLGRDFTRDECAVMLRLRRADKGGAG